MSTIAHTGVDVIERIIALDISGRVNRPRRRKRGSQGVWHPGMEERRLTLRRDSRPVMNDVITMEFMKSARLANPLWVLPSGEIQSLTARQ